MSGDHPADLVPPMPEPLPVKGSMWQRLRDFRHSAIALLWQGSYAMKMGEVRLPTRTLYFVNEPDLVRRVLVDEWERFPKSGLVFDMLHLLMGNSIFVSNGEVWKRQRRMMEPAFEAARLRDVFSLMVDAVADLEARLDAVADGRAVAIDEETTHVTADIIYRTIFSRVLDRDKAKRVFDAFAEFQELAYADAMQKLVRLPRWFSGRRRRAERAAHVIRDILEPAIRERLALRASGAADPRRDILASMIDIADPATGSKFSFDELVQQVAMLFLAGHETSASALAWALYLIARAPAVQDRLHGEAVSVLGDHRPEFRSLKRLAYTRDAFREAMRLYPPVAFFAREPAIECPMRDKRLKPGEIVFVAPWLIHRHRKLWQRPDAFDPDRFETAAGNESSRQAYLPFSLGPRVCLGAGFAMQEATLILASLARRYRFEPVEGHVPEPVARLTLRSQNGIRLRVLRR